MARQIAGILLAISTCVPLFLWISGTGLKYRSSCEEALYASPTQLVILAISFGLAAFASIKLSRYAAYIIPLMVIMSLTAHSWHQYQVANDAIRMAAQCGTIL